MFIILPMENFGNEIWVTTFCSPFYEVSNLGRVRTKDRYRPWSRGKERFYKSIILSCPVSSDGYEICGITLVDGRRNTCQVHQLVYHSFNNTRPVKGMHIDHIDGNRLNNKLNNLQFITHEENIKKGRTFTEKKSALPLYIMKRKSSFVIQKTINGKSVHFGAFPTLEEALKRKSELIKSKWSMHLSCNRNGREIPTNIFWSEQKKRFLIAKMIQGKSKVYGQYKTLEEAIQRKEELIKCNWKI